jgi:hypothetical protein
MIICVDALPPDAKRQAHAACLCDCGRVSSPRVSDFAAGKTGSCRCIKIDMFKAYQRQRAENLNPEVVRDIFLDSAKTGSWPGADLQVASRHDVPSHAVRAICQLHKERLQTKYGDRVRAEKYRLSINHRDLDKNLDVIEFNWIMKHAPRHDDDGLEIDWNDFPIGLQEAIIKHHHPSSAPMAHNTATPLIASHDSSRDCY